MTIIISPEASNDMEALIQHLAHEDEMGRILRAQLHLERLLLDYICKQVERPDYIEKKNFGFAARLNIALALGLDEELGAPLKEINLMRNDFAHVQGFTITPARVEKLEKKLSTRLKKAVTNSFKLANDSESFGDAKNYESLKHSDKLICIVLTLWSFMMYQTNELSQQHASKR